MPWFESDLRRNGHRLRMLVVAAVVAAAVLVVVPAAFESGTPNGLFAYVVPTTAGPLPACAPDGSNCSGTSSVSDFVYVANLNRLSQLSGFTTRATLANAFVVSSVDQSIYINGIHQTQFDTTFTPPPDSSPLPAWSGRWPATVTCQGQPGSFQRPCNVVGNPAVVPGETSSVIFATWAHSSAEPNGLYVFKYTIHGTLNGAALDLTATSPPIQMTG
jgi:hypothetical protein